MSYADAEGYSGRSARIVSVMTVSWTQPIGHGNGNHAHTLPLLVLYVLRQRKPVAQGSTQA